MNVSSEQIENFRELEPDGNPWIENVISAVKISWQTDGFNSRLDTMEEKIHEPAERAIKISQTEAERDKRGESWKTKQNLCDLWNSIKWFNV